VTRSRRSRRRLVAAPRGGLGNQLFNVVATVSVAQANGWSVDVDLRHAAHVGEGGIHALQMLLPARYGQTDIRVVPQASTVASVAQDLRRKVAGHTPRVGGLARAFTAAGLGHEPRLSGVRPGTRISGYFQTYSYADSLDRDALRSSLSLKSPSPEWHRLHRDLVDVTPIALHVRRGDYSSNKSFGILGPNYYSGALRHVQRIVGERPIWIFTDDTVGVTRDFPYAARIIGPELNAAEAMNLLSQAAGLVIANSSLSWWAAWLSGPTCPIVAPASWFARARVDIDALLPPQWTRLDPSFMGPSTGHPTQENP
jgi:hypothetical protein